MKVVVDREKCIASGACVLINPEVFTQDEDGIVMLVAENPSDELAHKLNEAVGACPALAIRIEE